MVLCHSAAIIVPLEKGKDCSSCYDKGIMIDPLIKDSFLEVERRSPWVCVMMCHGNIHCVIVKNPLIINLRSSETMSNVYITLSSKSPKSQKVQKSLKDQKGQKFQKVK